MKIELRRDQEDWLIQRIPGRFANLEAAVRVYVDKAIAREAVEVIEQRQSARHLKTANLKVPDYGAGSCRDATRAQADADDT